MHESVQPNINQHTLPQQPLQVPLGEIDHVELLDEPLLVPDYYIYIPLFSGSVLCCLSYC
jgi:hypothetical protein